MKTRERVTLAKGMAWVPPGRFVMGSNRHYPEERPAHEVTVDGFAMGIYPVTNTEFRRFINATGYRTTASPQHDQPSRFPMHPAAGGKGPR